MDLARKRDRNALRARREPYWQRLAKGAYLGFRRGPDTWVARYRTSTGKQEYLALDGVQPDDFDGAKRQAEEWIAGFVNAPVRTVARGTVKAALEGYVRHLKVQGRPDAAREALARFTLTVWTDRLAALQLEEARREDFMAWRERLRKGREARSVNRQVRALAAGLNLAVDELGHKGNPAAWKLAPLADAVEEESATAVFLTAAQRRALIDAAAPAAKPFLRALELTGARPGELAAARVSDFDGTALRLAHRKGRPPKLRARHVHLDAAGIDHFESAAKGKLPAAHLFTEDGETPWRRHVWARVVREAIAAHNADAAGRERIPPGATAYSFRHARISELLQVHGIDPLTVAQQAGTSVAMIEKAYFRFIPSAMAARLAAVKA